MYSSDFTARRRLGLRADDGAEGFCGFRHESLDLLHGARDAGQQLHPICCHRNVVFNANLEMTRPVKQETLKLSQCKNVDANKNSYDDCELQQYIEILGTKYQGL